MVTQIAKSGKNHNCSASPEPCRRRGYRRLSPASPALSVIHDRAGPPQRPRSLCKPALMANWSAEDANTLTAARPRVKKAQPLGSPRLSRRRRLFAFGHLDRLEKGPEIEAGKIVDVIVLHTVAVVSSDRRPVDSPHDGEAQRPVGFELRFREPLVDRRLVREVLVPGRVAQDVGRFVAAEARLHVQKDS